MSSVDLLGIIEKSKYCNNNTRYAGHKICRALYLADIRNLCTFKILVREINEKLVWQFWIFGYKIGFNTLNCNGFFEYATTRNTNCNRLRAGTKNIFSLGRSIHCVKRIYFDNHDAQNSAPTLT